MKILSLALLVTLGWSESAAASSWACKQGQHVEWIETCLFLLDGRIPGSRDPWVILRNPSYKRERNLAASFSSDCKAYFENPDKIEAHKWEKQPDLLDHLGQCDWSDHEQWLRSCIATVRQIRKRGTRGELVKNFIPENTTMSPEIYMSRDCPFLKVSVWFSLTSEAETADDVIDMISPYIDYPKSEP